MNDEFEAIRVQEMIWWDRQTEKECDAPTAEFDESRFQQRAVLRPYVRILHKGCGGKIEYKISVRKEDSKTFVTRWKVCKDCNKMFDVEEETLNE